MDAFPILNHDTTTHSNRVPRGQMQRPDYRRATANIPSSSNNLIPTSGISKSTGSTARNVIITSAEYWMLFPY